jgi:hypothetical protein
MPWSKVVSGCQDAQYHASLNIHIYDKKARVSQQSIKRPKAAK